MKKILVPLLIAALALTLISCKGSVQTLDAVPQSAELVYTHNTGFVDGIGVTYGSWPAPGQMGYFVVEVSYNGGKISHLTIHDQVNNETVASFGEVTGDRIFATEIKTWDNGNYDLFCGRLNKFDGEINVYFIPQ